MELRGILCTGLGEAAGYIALDWVSKQMSEKLGYTPYPGTLNLRLTDNATRDAWAKLQLQPGKLIVPPFGFCSAKCIAVVINECIRGAVVLPDVADYPVGKLEVVAPVAVRTVLGLQDGDSVRLRVVSI